MGISLPDLPVSMSEDNINLGEKDSIRRRALWALEGKPDVSFAKVEIPDNIDEPDFGSSFSSVFPSSLLTYVLSYSQILFPVRFRGDIWYFARFF
jgi:hypothetical protein